MRTALIALAAAATLVGPAAEAVARPATVACPQIHRTPVARLNQFPPSVRTALGHMANPNGRWNVGDAIGPGETHLPFKHLIAGGAMGQGRWLVVWEQGGFAHFSNVDVYRVGRDGKATQLVDLSGGDLVALCRQAAEKLPG